MLLVSVDLVKKFIYRSFDTLCRSQCLWSPKSSVCNRSAHFVRCIAHTAICKAQTGHKTNMIAKYFKNYGFMLMYTVYTTARCNSLSGFCARVFNFVSRIHSEFRCDTTFQYIQYSAYETIEADFAEEKHKWFTQFLYAIEMFGFFNRRQLCGAGKREEKKTYSKILFIK